MIPLPKGGSTTYNFWIDIDELTTDMVEWFKSIGGETKEDFFYDHRGKRKVSYYVKYGKGKWCHHHSGGLYGSRLHFEGNDASVASIFLLKYMQRVRQHNIQETMERYERDYK